MHIKKLLVANRGEIALRIMRTARELGMATVAVYSEADRAAPHVRYADEAICLGPPPAHASYLRGDRVVAAALQTGADAIHPGYGFLSENAAFARQVAAAGLCFVGPTPEAMETMGNKLAAKAAVARYHIPMVPGTTSPVTHPDQARQVARQIGYPVLIKASAGGGGKGMRVVENDAELPAQMQRAISEAQSAFGDGAVFIEKYVASPRHVEVQVLADHHGQVVHLFERECSVQRRHQKVVEEAPSVLLTPALRQRMGQSAVDVARACGYTNAGTVEFIVDEALNYYFLEMNTRLQVEHPVTELVTGVDLVREQLRVAEGRPLPFAQEELRLHGHAIELRVYAEDPANQFLPDVGRLRTYRRPQGPGVRVDDGFEEGMEVPIYYDPMLAKLIVWGQDRPAALARMRRAIDAYEVSGVATTLPFGRFVMNHPAFVSGQFDTGFVARYFDPREQDDFRDDEARVAALLAGELLATATAPPPTAAAPAPASGWRSRRRT